jgi:hypothetical protein
MKTGKSIVELATEIQRQAEAKRDFVVDTAALQMVANEGDKLSLEFGDQVLAIGGTAHDQIAANVGIPKKYYDRMIAEAPGLLANNVNHWMAMQPSKQMIRTLDGKARAYLSNSYRPMDNADLAEAVLPVLMDLGVEIMSAEITEKRLYIKAVDKSVVRQIPEGHHMGDGTHTIVRMADLYPVITISNSEIGHGGMNILAGTFNSFCTNLATFGERSMKKRHVGSKLGEFAEGDVYALLSDQSRKLSDAALWSGVRDVVKAAFDEAKFDALVAKIKGTQENTISGDVPKVVEVTAQRFGFTDTERKSVLDHLIRGGDFSQYGLHNAVTRSAEDLPDYDRATEFERYGGAIVEMGRDEWRTLAQAA